MNKLTRIGALSMILVAAISGTALATPRSTDIQDLKTSHRSIGYLWNSSHTLEAALATGVLPFEKGQMKLGADHPARATNPDSHHFQSDDTKLYPPADLTCALALLDRETV
jgi:hypothetical protein